MITAAKFLQEFVGDTPWLRLDIASAAWNDEDKPYLPKVFRVWRCAAWLSLR
jgi:leucyl aminopeptidase